MGRWESGDFRILGGKWSFRIDARWAVVRVAHVAKVVSSSRGKNESLEAVFGVGITGDGGFGDSGVFCGAVGDGVIFAERSVSKICGGEGWGDLAIGVCGGAVAVDGFEFIHGEF